MSAPTDSLPSPSRLLIGDGRGVSTPAAHVAFTFDGAAVAPGPVGSVFDGAAVAPGPVGSVS